MILWRLSLFSGLVFPFLALMIQMPGCAGQNKNQPHLSIHSDKGPQPSTPFAYNICTTVDGKIFALGDPEFSGQLEVYDPNADQWLKLAPHPYPAIFQAAAVVNEEIYVFGGLDSNGNYQKHCWKYFPDENAWIPCPDMTTPRSRFAAAVWGSKIFVFGGLEGESDQSFRNSHHTDCYDPQQNTWEPRSPMPTARHGHSAIKSGNRIIVVGGYTDSGITGMVEIYDPEKDKWESASNMLTARGFLGVVVIDNLILAIGGRLSDSIAPIEVYDPEIDKWTSIPSTLESVQRFGACSLEKNIYLIGGEGNPGSFLIGMVTYGDKK